MPLYKGAGWERVAKHVGHGLTGRQCKGRWNNYLRLAQKDYINQGEWTDKEVLWVLSVENLLLVVAGRFIV